MNERHFSYFNEQVYTQLKYNYLFTKAYIENLTNANVEQARLFKYKINGYQYTHQL